jgi:hypothetical protein
MLDRAVLMGRLARSLRALLEMRLKSEGGTPKRANKAIHCALCRGEGTIPCPWCCGRMGGAPYILPGCECLGTATVPCNSLACFVKAMPELSDAAVAQAATAHGYVCVDEAEVRSIRTHKSPDTLSSRVPGGSAMIWPGWVTQ